MKPLNPTKLALAALLLTFAFIGGAFAQESLTPEQAVKLIAGRKGGGPLKLNELKSLSPEVATVLAGYEGELSLNGLETLSPEVAAALARHPASARFAIADISLNGLTRLTPETAAALAAHQGAVALKGLQALDSLPLAQKLARQWGELELNGLTTLTPEIAAILATNEGVLVDRTRPGVELHRADHAPSVLRLDNLPTLDASTAQALAKQKGILVLNGLTALAPAAATALVKHQGRLYLTGLTSLSHESRAALRGHPEIVLPEALRD